METNKKTKEINRILNDNSYMEKVDDIDNRSEITTVKTEFGLEQQVNLSQKDYMDLVEAYREAEEKSKDYYVAIIMALNECEKGDSGKGLNLLEEIIGQEK